MKTKKRIYQIYTGRWEEANVLDHNGRVLKRMEQMDWASLKQRLGLTHIYLLGLWDTGDQIVVNEEQGMDLTSHELRCPSAFAIINHQKVAPNLGSRQDLIKLITTIHLAGMKIYVDYVANHTGLAHPWLKQHPEWYKLDNQGQPNRAFSGDVSELNYECLEMEKQMLMTGMKLAELGVDGFRCDMAHLVPEKFWIKLVNQVKSIKTDFSFIAESYETNVFDHNNEQKLKRGGFEAVYDFSLFENLRKISRGERLDYLAAYINYLINEQPNGLVHYLNNHDDAYPLPANTYGNMWELLVALPGETLLFNGSESGYTGRLAHHFVEVLPKQFTDGSRMPTELTDWLGIIDQPDFRLLRVEAINDQTLQARWQSDQSEGQKDFDLGES